MGETEQNNGEQTQEQTTQQTQQAGTPATEQPTQQAENIEVKNVVKDQEQIQKTSEIQGIQQANKPVDKVEEGIPQPMKIGGTAIEKKAEEHTDGPVASPQQQIAPVAVPKDGGTTSARTSSIGDAPPIRVENDKKEESPSPSEGEEPSTKSEGDVNDKEGHPTEENNEENEEKDNPIDNESNVDNIETDEKDTESNEGLGEESDEKEENPKNKDKEEKEVDDSSDASEDENGSESQEDVGRPPLPFGDPFTNLAFENKEPEVDPRKQGDDFVKAIPGKMRIY